MSERSRDMSRTEAACRRIHSAGHTVAGARGRRVANRITEAAGLGRVDWCDGPNCGDPACQDCLPAK